MDTLMLESVVQYGFAGFAAVQMVVLVWVVRNLIVLLDATGRVIAENTRVIGQLSERQGDMLHLSRALHDRLLSRPCLREGA